MIITSYHRYVIITFAAMFVYTEIQHRRAVKTYFSIYFIFIATVEIDVENQTAAEFLKHVSVLISDLTSVNMCQSVNRHNQIIVMYCKVSFVVFHRLYRYTSRWRQTHL